MVALMEDAFGPAKDRRFSVTLRSSSEAVRQTLSLIPDHGAFRRSGLGHRTWETLEMVLPETLNNVVVPPRPRMSRDR